MVFILLNTPIRVITPDQPNGFITMFDTEPDVSISKWDPGTFTAYMDEVPILSIHNLDVEYIRIGKYPDYLYIYIPQGVPDRDRYLQDISITNEHDIKSVQVRAQLVPVIDRYGLLSPYDGYEELEMNGTILIESILYPSLVVNGNEYKEPINIREVTARALSYHTTGIYINVGFLSDSDEFLIDVAENINMMRDEGYRFDALSPISGPVSAIYKLSQFEGVVLRFYESLYRIRGVADTIKGIKEKVDGIINGTNNESLDLYHQLFHTLPPYMGWFVHPSGWYRYGLNTGHEWIYHMDTIDIETVPELTDLLSSFVKTIPRIDTGWALGSQRYEGFYFGVGITAGRTDNESGGRVSDELRYTSYDEDTYGESEILRRKRRVGLSYSLPDKIRDALQSVNTQTETKVVLAGGFVVTQGDYDFFILNGDITVARQLAQVLGMNNVTQTGAVISDTEQPYQLILATDMKSLLDVIYSFDLSHVMIAHDGYRFSVSPEFITFITGAMSLLVLPVTRTKRLDKAIRRGLAIGSPHQFYMTDFFSEEIDRGDLEVRPIYNIQTRDSETIPIDQAFRGVSPGVIGKINFMYGNDRYTEIFSNYMTGSEIIEMISNPAHDVVSIYMDPNGINVGSSQIDPDKTYHIEYEGTRNYIQSIHLVREVSKERSMYIETNNHDY